MLSSNASAGRALPLRQMKQLTRQVVNTFKVGDSVRPMRLRAKFRINYDDALEAYRELQSLGLVDEGKLATFHAEKSAFTNNKENK